MAPFGETVRFCKIGEDVVSSFARAHDLRILCLSSLSNRCSLCITKNGVVRGKSWTRQTLGDAWDTLANGGSRIEVDKESQLTTKEGDIHCQGLWWKEFRRLSQEDSTCCRQTSRLTVTQGFVWVVQHWHRMEERSNHTTTNVENETE